MTIIAAAAAALILALPSKAAAPHHAPPSWVHGTFATCVRLRESHNGADPNAHGNLYGIQNPNGDGGYSWAGQFPRATQDWLACQMFLRYGVQPWRPYDGC